MYIRSPREAEEVARLARVLGRHTGVQDIYRHNRHLVSVVDRLFGDDPQKKEFLIAARDAIRALRAR